jgi:ribosomal protein S18 acetylase RimI-like enzyme
MLFRSLAPEDASPFHALRLRGLQECPEAFASSYDEEKDIAIAERATRLAPKEGSAMFGAFEQSVLVGLAGLQRESMAMLSHKAFLWGVYVAPEARRKSVGEHLIRFALEFAGKTLGVRSVNLGVNTENKAALSLYKKLGFQQYGLEREFLFVHGRYHDEYQMVCQVAGDA